MFERDSVLVRSLPAKHFVILCLNDVKHGGRFTGPKYYSAAVTGGSGAGADLLSQLFFGQRFIVFRIHLCVSDSDRAVLSKPDAAPLVLDDNGHATFDDFARSILAEQWLSHLAALRALKMDWPRNDSIYDHVYSNQALTHLLNEYGIEHEAEEFNGMGDDPYWGKNPRMLTDVLPFLAEHLQVNQK